MPENKDGYHEKQVSIRMSNEMYEALSKYAKKMGGINRSNLIKMAIQEWLVKREREEGKSV
jgi:metal-responsive CopG/Arc/MetJ family transcriptional regulator